MYLGTQPIRKRRSRGHQVTGPLPPPCLTATANQGLNSRSPLAPPNFRFHGHEGYVAVGYAVESVRWGVGLGFPEVVSGGTRYGRGRRRTWLCLLSGFFRSGRVGQGVGGRCLGLLARGRRVAGRVRLVRVRVVVWAVARSLSLWMCEAVEGRSVFPSRRHVLFGSSGRPMLAVGRSRRNTLAAHLN